MPCHFGFCHRQCHRCMTYSPQLCNGYSSQSCTFCFVAVQNLEPCCTQLQQPCAPVSTKQQLHRHHDAAHLHLHQEGEQPHNSNHVHLYLLGSCTDLAMHLNHTSGRKESSMAHQPLLLVSFVLDQTSVMLSYTCHTSYCCTSSYARIFWCRSWTWTRARPWFWSRHRCLSISPAAEQT